MEPDPADVSAMIDGHRFENIFAPPPPVKKAAASSELDATKNKASDDSGTDKAHDTDKANNVAATENLSPTEKALAARLEDLEKRMKASYEAMLAEELGKLKTSTTDGHQKVEGHDELDEFEDEDEDEANDLGRGQPGMHPGSHPYPPPGFPGVGPHGNPGAHGMHPGDHAAHLQHIQQQTHHSMQMQTEHSAAMLRIQSHFAIELANAKNELAFAQTNAKILKGFGDFLNQFF